MVRTIYVNCNLDNPDDLALYQFLTECGRAKKKIIQMALKSSGLMVGYTPEPVVISEKKKEPKKKKEERREEKREVIQEPITQPAPVVQEPVVQASTPVTFSQPLPSPAPAPVVEQTVQQQPVYQNPVVTQVPVYQEPVTQTYQTPQYTPEPVMQQPVIQEQVPQGRYHMFTPELLEEIKAKGCDLERLSEAQLKTMAEEIADGTPIMAAYRTASFTA